MVGRLVAKPANLKEACDAMNIGDNCDVSKLASYDEYPCVTSVDHHTINSKRARPWAIDKRPCYCPLVWRQKQQSVLYGLLEFSYGIKDEGHHPSCALFSIAGRRREQTVGMRLAGLAAVLKSAITISFSIAYGAGGWGISPSFTYRPTVDHTMAPEFRILDVLQRYIYRIERPNAHEVIDWSPTETEQSTIWEAARVKISRLFQERKASPLAISFQNRNLIHSLCELVGTNKRYRYLTALGLVLLILIIDFQLEFSRSLLSSRFCKRTRGVWRSIERV